MYQYYNYLIFEKNKDSFNDINPDLRKMTYKYDSEVKNAYMTVQASPEVIKAAMGMNVSQDINIQPFPNADGTTAVLPPSNTIKEMKPKIKKEDKFKKYTKETIMKIF